MNQQADEAVEVLREVWAARGQSSADLEDSFGPQKSCKTMADVGFDGLTAAAGSDGDLRSAWRGQLEREGKLNREAGTIRDLVLGSDADGDGDMDTDVAGHGGKQVPGSGEPGK